MKLIESYLNATHRLENLKDLPLLFLRLILAYGFWITANMKLGNVSGIANWFESMNYPFPLLNAYLATITETAGVILLALGLGTRLISVPLIIVMLVAITTVHWGNGFDAGDNGSEIPLYYILMLIVLIVYGPGRISIDNLIEKKLA